MTAQRLNILADIDGTPPAALAPALVQLLYDLKDRLPLFVLYDRPADFPDHYVARLWISSPVVPVGIVLRSKSLDVLRDFVGAWVGLVHLDRSPGDDPAILETWL